MRIPERAVARILNLEGGEKAGDGDPSLSRGPVTVTRPSDRAGARWPSRQARPRLHATPADWVQRPDIEGLRAVAVLLVVLFHASIGGVVGGFVGVDVFFVLSGFLITGLLLRELQATGTISLRTFYARRARRLLPASIVVLLVTLAASALLLPPLLVPGVAADTAAAAAYVSNLGFAWQATDYFSAAQAPSPILHYWSLGVEEQFYVFWPALLLLVGGRGRNSVRRVGTTVVLVIAISFGLGLWLTSAAPPWAFFSLPTRAWELGLGAILAVAGTRLRSLPAGLATIAGWLGLGMVIVAAFALDESVPFPGSAALLPTIGTALVVVSGAQATRFGPARALGTAIPRFFGRISYSLYLWHWPLLVIPAVAAQAPLPIAGRLGLVGLAICLAAVTQHWLEAPLRSGRLIGTVPGRNLAMAGALSLSVVLASVGMQAVTASGLHRSEPGTAAVTQASVDSLLNALASETPEPTPIGSGTASAPPSADASTPPSAPPSQLAGITRAGGPSSGSQAPASASPSSTRTPAPPVAAPLLFGDSLSRPPTPDSRVPVDLQPALANAAQDLAQAYVDGCHTQTDGHMSAASCVYGDPTSSTTIALFGDSHALAWFPAVNALALKQGWRFLSLTMSTCSPATIPVWVPQWKRFSWECNDWRQKAIQRLISERPAIIVVAGTRGFQTTDPSGTVVLEGDARTAAWQAGMQVTLSQLVPPAGRVILVGDAPLSHFDPPVCLSQHPESALACATPVTEAISASWLQVEHDAAVRAGAGFVDPEQWICPSSPCPAILGNVLIYRDTGHLTATFAAALAGRLGTAILEDVTRSRSGRAP